MTINDTEVNEHCMRARLLAETLPILQRNGNELALFIALSDIEKAAHAAQNRLNQIRYAATIGN